MPTDNQPIGPALSATTERPATTAHARMGGCVSAPPARCHLRDGWAEDARAIAAAGDDVLVWPEFGNDEDADLRW